MNYPVTTPFGAVKDYPLNPIPDKPGYGFHNGIDYGYPCGTEVVVNGITIGLSNNTGASTGCHLHVGKFVNGTVQDPGIGNGFQFSSAVVYDTGQDSTNGNYVRITGDGALWNYLHLQSTSVTKGQILKGEPVEPADYKMNSGDAENMFQAILGRAATDADVKYYTGRVWKDAMYDLTNSDEYKKRIANTGVNHDSALKYVEDNLQ